MDNIFQRCLNRLAVFNIVYFHSNRTLVVDNMWHVHISCLFHIKVNHVLVGVHFVLTCTLFYLLGLQKKISETLKRYSSSQICGSFNGPLYFTNNYMHALLIYWFTDFRFIIAVFGVGWGVDIPSKGAVLYFDILFSISIIVLNAIYSGSNAYMILYLFIVLISTSVHGLSLHLHTILQMWINTLYIL